MSVDFGTFTTSIGSTSLRQSRPRGTTLVGRRGTKHNKTLWPTVYGVVLDIYDRVPLESGYGNAQCCLKKRYARIS